MGEYVWSVVGNDVKIERFTSKYGNELKFINMVEGTDGKHLLSEIDAVLSKRYCERDDLDGFAWTMDRKHRTIQNILCCYDYASYDTVHHY